MSSSTGSPELNQPKNTQHAGCDAIVVWSYCAEDSHPLGWWRMLPPHLLGDAERVLVISALEGLAVVGGGKEIAAALKGDAAAAISVALSLVPLREVTLKVDIAVTALLATALNGDPAALLVLSHILGRAQWGDPSAEDLGLAWLDLHIARPMDSEQFAASEAALATAFCREE
jgi:hypothetical protein